MNLMRNGVRRQDRLVLLGSFQAHQVLEKSRRAARPGLQVETPFLGVEPEASPHVSSRTGRAELLPPAVFAVGFRWRLGLKSDQNGQGESDVHGSPAWSELTFKIPSQHQHRQNSPRHQAASEQFGGVRSPARHARSSPRAQRKRPPEPGFRRPRGCFSSELVQSSLPLILGRIRRRPTGCRAFLLPPRG